MTSSYTNKLTPTPCEVHVLVNSQEPNMLLKTVLRGAILFPDSKSLVGKVQRNRCKAIIGKAHSSHTPSASTHLSLKKNTFNNT